MKSIFRDRMGNELSGKQAGIKIINRLFSYFEDLELFIVRLVGLLPIHTFRWLIYKSAGVKIGKHSHFHMGTQFFNPLGVTVGWGTIIGQNAFLDGRGGLKIGDHVAIASDVLIYTSEHDINSEDFIPTLAAVNIEDYCFIGPRAIILPGVSIGKGAVVAAGAVVTKDVKELDIVGGVPAKIISQRRIKEFKYKLGRARLFQ